MPSSRPTLGLDGVKRVVDTECLRPRTPPRVGVELEWLVMTPPARRVAPAEPSPPPGASLPSGTRVSFEPGGQLELSSPPCPDPDTVCQVLSDDLSRMQNSLSPQRLDLVGMGADPLNSSDMVVRTPRYHAMDQYFTNDGPAGRMMMRDTASVQVNLETGSETDMDGRWCLAHHLGPTLAAAFANSPFSKGLPSGWSSTRLENWWGIDPTRTAPALRAGSARSDWRSYALDARVMLIRCADDDYRAVDSPMAFRDWISNGHRFGWPTEDDFRYHLTTLFPPVRPLGRLELRFIDALPEPWWRVAVAVSSSLLDDPEASGRARAATATTSRMWREAGRRGLAHPALASSARQCFDAATDALRDRSSALSDLVSAYQDRYVNRGRSPADERMDEWIRSGALLPPAVPVGQPETLQV